MARDMAYAEKNPPVCLIELTNACNANCKICVRNSMTRPIGFISDEFYKKIIDELSAWETGYREIILVGFGETALDPKLPERVRYAKEKGINKVQMFSNGSMLNRGLIDALISAGLDEIVFSIDSIDPEKYEDIRKLHFNVVLENLEYFIEKSRGTGTSVLINSVAYSKDSFRDIKEIYKKYSDRIKAAIFTMASNWVGLKDGLDYSLFNNSVYAGVGNPPCAHLWTFLPIRWDGDVSLCCMDFDSKVSIGNLNTEGLKDIWNGERLNGLRRLHQSGSDNLIPVCRDCNYYRNWWMR